ncbi:diguanylate cyclase (GGDEF)-like protein/PAS domain S-box-containing protein [Granulicella aggregans]|uniref:Diguanylate cyclase (GGDEF)-like protein/PAS domain S-box-containing protein n=1 Tax=Granulicella aggregans TaxID=474949 RepID=A0A7W7ZBH5_9BACT|nr:EAL domain-containing protein [Granulicella aggregans]MBB5056712.1 diguanylate cyclase (GGDEF)-like protein/PAS domain S-box-containing protein [Granulicella aggregans]
MRLLEQTLSETRASLEESESIKHQYINLYELAPVGYLTLDLLASVLDVNRTGTRLLSGRRDEIIGLPFAGFVVAQDEHRYAQLLEDVTASGDPERMDLSLRRLDGTIFDAQIDCLRVTAKDVRSPVRLTVVDITARKKAEAEIKHLAFYDPLTSLPNRRLLLDRLQHAFLECVRTHHHGAIFFIDLNSFKNLNDTQGHVMGDLLLQQVAARITGCIRECDTVARLGGDEFIVMILHLSKNPVEAAEQAKVVGEKILATFEACYQLNKYEYCCSGSLGVTLFKDNLSSVEDLLKRADMALYRAKTMGISTMQFFDPEMQAVETARDVLDVDLRRGLQENEFVLYYQPQVDSANKLTGVEALLRWPHPKRGLLSPGEFIAFAEEKGLIGLIGQWVLEAACIQLLRWSADPETAELTIAINVSALEFSHPEFVPRMLKVIDRTGINPKRLVLEFTERVMLGLTEDTVSKMRALKARGLYFSLDDFGIGYSSLGYLQSLPLDELKIDRTFVKDILTNPNDAVIACSIMALGASLGLAVVAEGVETQEQRDYLASQGCKAYQGYLFGRPVPIAELRLGRNVRNP